MSDKLHIIKNINEFFYEQVSLNFKSKKMQISKEVEFYVVDLLSRFIKSDNFFSIDSNGSYKNDPLIFLLKEAHDEQNPEHKKLIYRQVGDIALCSVGMKLTKGSSDSYYCALGQTAYTNTASLCNKENIKSVYNDLSYFFSLIAESLKKINYNFN